MPNSQKEFFDYLPTSRIADSFFFNPVTQTEIGPIKQGSWTVFFTHSRFVISKTYS